MQLSTPPAALVASTPMGAPMAAASKSAHAPTSFTVFPPKKQNGGVFLVVVVQFPALLKDLCNTLVQAADAGKPDFFAAMASGDLALVQDLLTADPSCVGRLYDYE